MVRTSDNERMVTPEPPGPLTWFGLRVIYLHVSKEVRSSSSSSAR
jgi:hypothetical protein